MDPGLYNALLYRDGEGLLPAELTQIISADHEAHLVIVDRLHPAVRGLSREGDPLGIGRIPFLKYFGCVPFAPAPGDGTEHEDDRRLGVCPRNRPDERGRGLGMGQPSASARGGSRNRNWRGRQRHVSPADHG